MSGLKFSAKELARIVAQPDYAIVNGDSKPQKRQDLSKLLPEGSKLEVRFMQLWAAMNGPKLDREIKFHPRRKWRFDFCHMDTKTAIEVEGGTRSGGRHTRHDGYRADAEKYNEAQYWGWTVYRLTYDMINVIELQKIIDYIKESTK
jgi:very-short-patch-repair endonuclease